MEKKKSLSHEDVSDYITFMRVASGFSITELADRLGMNRATISHFANKHNLPRDPIAFCKKLREVVVSEIKRKREKGEIMNTNDIRVRISYYRNLMNAALKDNDQTAYEVYGEEVKRLQEQLRNDPNN